MSSPITDRPRPPRDVSLDRDRRDDEDTYTGPDSDDALVEEEPAAREQRAEALGHYLTTDLCGEEVRIVPSGAWRASTNRKIRVGDLDGFMADVLHPDDYDRYVDLDPTADEFQDFVNEAQNAGGGQGKSAGPRRSSRPTRRQ